MGDIISKNRPLADRMRPENLGEFLGQDEIIGKGKLLRDAIESDQAPSMILWGPPECNVILAQAVVYMAKCKKSNELYIAYGKAASDVQEHGSLPVPLHICNAPTKLMKDLGYGKDYKYSPKFDYKEEQYYLPEKLKGKKYL